MKGAVCKKHECSYCCKGTEMPVTLEDIARISEYAESEFYHRDTMQLRNINGRCVFLSEDGICNIYDIRPWGCKLYPLIMTLPSMEPLLDEECPHRSEFVIEPESVMELRDLVEKLLEEGL